MASSWPLHDLLIEHGRNGLLAQELWKPAVNAKLKMDLIKRTKAKKQMSQKAQQSGGDGGDGGGGGDSGGGGDGFRYTDLTDDGSLMRRLRAFDDGAGAFHRRAHVGHGSGYVANRESYLSARRSQASWTSFARESLDSVATGAAASVKSPGSAGSGSAASGLFGVFGLGGLSSLDSQRLRASERASNLSAPQAGADSRKKNDAGVFANVKYPATSWKVGDALDEASLHPIEEQDVNQAGESASPAASLEPKGEAQVRRETG